MGIESLVIALVEGRSPPLAKQISGIHKVSSQVVFSTGQVGLQAEAARATVSEPWSRKYRPVQAVCRPVQTIQSSPRLNRL